MSIIARTDSSVIGHWWWTVDRLALAILGSLIVLGAIMVAAASPAVAERIGLPYFHFVMRHLIYLAPTVVIMLGLSTLTPLAVRRLAGLALIGGIIGLILTLIIGDEINGATRWLRIAGFSIQPSEFVKPAFAVTAAWLFSVQHQQSNVPGYVICTLIFAVIAGLLLMQPDLGMTVVITAIWVAESFIAGLPLSIFVGIGMATIGGIAWAYFTFPHVASRIDRFIDPASGDNYQVEKSLEAFRTGGVFGTGPGQGEVKLQLPDAHADFIFSVAGEEFGLITTALIVLLFAGLVLRALARAKQSNNLFIQLAVGGLAVQIGIQALIHMGSALHLIPAKGMTLPLISYGGSSLLSLGLTLGMLLALTRRWQGGVR